MKFNPMGVEIEIFSEGGVTFPFRGLDKKDIKDIIEKICAILSMEDVLITLIAVYKEYIQGLNKNFRGKNQPTDIITFAYRENPFPQNLDRIEHLGDVYISLEQAEENAGNYAVDFIEEIARLIVHGILHLIGYDHEGSDADTEKMSQQEEEVLKSLLRAI